MEGSNIILVLLLGIISRSHTWTSRPESEVRIRAGENITLYCDCNMSTGVFIVWYRNCSHENQPSLVLTMRALIKEKHFRNLVNAFQFKFVKNDTSVSFDLLIENVTASHEGLYYCGTETTKVVDEQKIGVTEIYTYGRITTRLIIDSPRPPLDLNQVQQDCDLCWKLFYCVCPAVSVLSTVFSSLLVYLFCRKTAVKTGQDDLRMSSTKRQSQVMQDEEDVCYAALEVHQASYRPKRKRPIERSDFSTYSAIKTSPV